MGNRRDQDHQEGHRRDGEISGCQSSRKTVKTDRMRKRKKKKNEFHVTFFLKEEKIKPLNQNLLTTRNYYIITYLIVENIESFNKIVAHKICNI